MIPLDLKASSNTIQTIPSQQQSFFWWSQQLLMIMLSPDSKIFVVLLWMRATCKKKVNEFCLVPVSFETYIPEESCTVCDCKWRHPEQCEDGKKLFFVLLKIQLSNLTKGPILGAHVRTKAGRTRRPTREVQRKLEHDLAKLDLDLEEVLFRSMLLDAQALMWVRETTGEECSQIWNPDFISTGCVWDCTRSIPAWGEMLFNELVHFWRLDALSPFWLEEEEGAWGGIRNRIPACLAGRGVLCAACYTLTTHLKRSPLLLHSK